jgi:hypothetical protein
MSRERTTVSLVIVQMHWNDVYKDWARIPERFRVDQRGQPIPEGRICKVWVGKRHVLLSLRGQPEHNNRAIHLDEKTRIALDVKVNSDRAVRFRQVGPIGQFIWAWQASDPAYRLAARIGLLSIIMSAAGTIAMFIHFYRWWRGWL